MAENKYINKVVYGGKTLIDLTGDTATADKVLKDMTFHDKTGATVTGTMKNNGSVEGSIATKEQVYTIPQGFHDGSGNVQIATAEQAKLIPKNIRDGITILGVRGTMSGTEGAKPQQKTVTPSTATQTIMPDAGYNYLSQVTVNPIPYTESENSAGGTTVTIA